MSTLLIAHRGASREAPENSLAAFDLAWRQGADGIEADFRLTRDGRIVCLHDATTGRTGDGDLRVADATLQELGRLDIGAWKGARWRGERLVTLEEVLARLPAGKMIMIELKCGPEILAPLREILAAAAVAPAQVRLLAFDARLIASAKVQCPDIRTCLNVDYRWSVRTGSWSPSRAELHATLAQIGADGISSRAHAMLDARFIDELRQQGREIHVWTIDAVRTAARYHGLGVDSIITNRPGWLRSRLEDAGKEG